MFEIPEEVIEIIDILESQLAKAEKVIEFYGDRKRWRGKALEPKKIFNCGINNGFDLACAYFKDKEGKNENE